MSTRTMSLRRPPAVRRLRIALAATACSLALTATPAAQAHAGVPAPTPWTMELPLARTDATDFFDSSATGRNDAWAVGRQADESWNWSPVAKHWDGTRWSDVPLAGTGGRPAQLDAVAATAPDDVWVAGTFTDVDISASSLPKGLAARLPEGAARSAADSQLLL